MVNVLGIIQARMASNRLPAKIMLDLAGKPLLARVIESVRATQCIDELIVATSDDGSDDITKAFCEQNKMPCFRGSSSNVLARFYQAAKIYQPKYIVRITADNPLTSAILLDDLYAQFIAAKV
ncbi:MAG: NTP transferase domain-containing protein, partial [Gammaproteobacteria bacterium]|nr:NTP transferase domain-containing protein [Gammaproteobacteria bacterium]